MNTFEWRDSALFETKIKLDKEDDITTPGKISTVLTENSELNRVYEIGKVDKVTEMFMKSEMVQ